jgi:hypothetical protein
MTRTAMIVVPPARGHLNHGVALARLLAVGAVVGLGGGGPGAVLAGAFAAGGVAGEAGAVGVGVIGVCAGGALAVQGRSRAAGSLVIWTHRMREVTVHDSFVPAGSPVGEAGVPAITVGAGSRWLEAYQALLPYGRYVQGGGCVTVGAAGGFTQVGGFWSLSRRYGTAADNTLVAEVVTASSEILTANTAQHRPTPRPVLGAARRRGRDLRRGHQAHPANPTAQQTLGRVAGTITASSDADFRRLLGRLARSCRPCATITRASTSPSPSPM